MMTTELFDGKEAANFLHVSIHTIRAWSWQRKLPAVRLGRKLLFRREDLENFIKRNVVEAKAE
jgi:excisionase family DNA binding protein